MLVIKLNHVNKEAPVCLASLTIRPRVKDVNLTYGQKGGKLLVGKYIAYKDFI